MRTGGGEVMTDPAVIPWSAVWYGLVLLICGAPLVLHDISQCRLSRVADAGKAIIIFGVVMMLGTPLVNGTVMLVKAFSAVAKQAVAAAVQPQGSKGAPR